MENVEVSYPEERDVILDGQVAGKTNTTLMVQEGTHDFDLGEPPDYDPASQRIQVTGTDPVNPLVVVFSKKDA